MNIFKKLHLIFRFKIWANIRRNKFSSFYLSHSQFGEDMVIRSLFPHKNDGFYIDIGAHHPVFYSNTYYLYQRGWHGINIDALPGAMEQFNILRSRDINLEACIAEKSDEEVKFYEFDMPAFNTIDENVAKQVMADGRRLVNEHKLKTINIMDCLSRYNLQDKSIDYLNIDIEGVDSTILQSIDFDSISPSVISFEDHHFDIADLSKSVSTQFLISKGYEFYAKAGPTVIMKRKD